MRRIFTFSFIAIAFSLASFKTFAQTCNVSASVQNPNPLFGSTVPVQGSATPGADFNSSNQGTLGSFNQNSTTELISPIVFYNTIQGAQTAVYFKYHLTSGALNQTATPSQYSITLIYSNNQTISCGPTTWTAGAIPSGNSGGADYYFWISGINWPVNRNFRIRLTLTTDNRTVVATAFRTNATFPIGAATLPVKFQSLEATPSNNAVALKWAVGTEENVSGYAVEKSLDGRNFSKVGFVNAANQTVYSFVDAKSAGTVYYRIKSVDVDGKFGFSTIVLVKAGSSLIVLNAYPSPFISSFSLDHGTAAAGSLITISSEDGRTIKTIIPTAGSQRTSVDLSSAKAGMYLVRFKNSNGQVETLKILKSL